MKQALMNPSAFLAAAASMILCSCSAGKYPFQPFYSGLPDRQQIVSIVFDELLGPGFCRSWPSYEAQTRYDFRERFRDRTVMEQILDSLASLPDSVRCIVYVGDTTLSGCCSEACDEAGKRSVPDSIFSQAYFDVDPSWYPLICRQHAVSRVSKPFDVSSVHTRYRYHIRNARSHDRQTDIFDPVTVQFSMIGFDEDETRACIYTSMYCGPLCASWDLWFLRKTRAGWKLEALKNLGAS